MYSYNDIYVQCTAVLLYFRICRLIGVPTFKFVSSHQWTPLHWAADQGHVQTAQLLVGKGADINAQDSDGVH